MRDYETASHRLSAMPRFVLIALAGLLPFAGCTFEGRTDGGSPRHDDNGALQAHRQAVADAVTPEVVEPLDSGPAAPSAAPVPTPRMDTANDAGGITREAGSAAPGTAGSAVGGGAGDQQRAVVGGRSGALATPPVPVPGGGQAPAGSTTGSGQ